MAQAVAVVRGTLSATASGTTDFTKSGFGVAAAALVFVCEANSGANPAANAMICIGFWDGTNQRVMMSHATDAGASSLTRRCSNDAFGVITRDVGDSQYTISAVTDGIRITLTTDNTAIERHCTVLLIGGVSALAGTFTPNGTEDATTESGSLGHAPGIIFFMTHGTSTVDTSIAAALFSFGFARSDGMNRCIQWQSVSGAADATLSIAFSEDRCVAQVSTSSGANQWAGQVTAFGSDTFTMTTRDGNSGGDITFFLSLGGAALSLDAGTFTTETSTGVGAAIATDVPVEALLLGLTTCTAVGGAVSGDAATGLMLGLADADGQFAHNFSEEDGAATMNANSASSADRAINLDTAASGGPVDMVDATVALNSGDWTPNYSAVSASGRKGFWIAFGTAGGAQPEAVIRPAAAQFHIFGGGAPIGGY